MKTIEEKIEITINALDGVQSIEVPSSVIDSLKRIPEQQQITSINSIQKWMIAASIAIIVSLNFITIVQYYKSSKNDSTPTTSGNVVYKEYFSSEY
jgi:heme/copper-type cytochrome/quinol oxidase subunit 2